MPNLLDKIFSGGVKSAIDAVSGVVDKFITTPDEKKAFLKEAEERLLAAEQQKRDFATKLFEQEFADTANSRESNLHIQQSEFASWMSKNTGYMLDITITLIWSGLTFYIAAKYMNIIKATAGVDFSGVWGLYSTVTGVMMIVVGWHRGSSRGSAEKQMVIDKMAKK